MNPSLINKRILGLSVIISFLIILGKVFLSIYNRQTKIVFCDVGQGDAAYIRIKNTFDLLVDVGPDKKVLNCLGKHMPFYDRQIEMVIISHWQKDHYGGLLPILEHYQIKQIVVDRQTEINKIKKVLKQPPTIIFVDGRNHIDLLDDKIDIYWPIANGLFLDDNTSSLIFTFEERLFKVLFTADAPINVLSQLPKQKISHVSVLKVPHHGSKTGLNKTFLKLADPDLSVISVGKNNSYGHPNKEVLDYLKALNKKYWRTDENGELVIYVPS